MGEIHVHEFISLDGVIDAPIWTFDYGFLPEMGEEIGAVTARSSGILLGRVTYEAFEPAWSTRTVEDDPGAPFFNETAKYVVSSTLTNPTWNNSKVLGPYDAGAIRRLKDEVDGDIYVSGSGMLVRAMLADGLVDELHLFVYPLTRGAGPRLFPEDAAPAKLELDPEQVVRQRRRLPGVPPAELTAAPPPPPADGGVTGLGGGDRARVEGALRIEPSPRARGRRAVVSLEGVSRARRPSHLARYPRPATRQTSADGTSASTQRISSSARCRTPGRGGRRVDRGDLHADGPRIGDRLAERRRHPRPRGAIGLRELAGVRRRVEHVRVEVHVDGPPARERAAPRPPRRSTPAARAPRRAAAACGGAPASDRGPSSTTRVGSTGGPNGLSHCPVAPDRASPPSHVWLGVREREVVVRVEPQDVQVGHGAGRRAGASRGPARSRTRRRAATPPPAGRPARRRGPRRAAAAGCRPARRASRRPRVPPAPACGPPPSSTRRDPGQRRTRGRRRRLGARQVARRRLRQAARDRDQRRHAVSHATRRPARNPRAPAPAWSVVAPRLSAGREARRAASAPR